MKPPMRIIFMGSPEFAVASLDILLQNGYDIVGVITAPDRPAGRGRKLKYSAVKRYALENDLHILQPTNLKSPEFQAELSALNADLQVVVAFRMLPEAVWSMPARGTINLHASLLPQYRGAAPINWVLINGESETGLTTFFIDKSIDTGDLLFQRKISLSERTTAGELHDEMMTAGAELVLETVHSIESGNYESIPQHSDEELRKAPKIHRDDCRIDWTEGAKSIYDRIRGLSPYPAAFTKLKGKTLKVFGSAYTLIPHSHPAGMSESDEKTYLRFYSPDGYIDLTEIQLEGKRRMLVEDFLRGYTWDD